MSTAKEERVRHYQLKADRTQHRIEQIGDEYLPTLAASSSWQLFIGAARGRLERLKAELLQSVQDRRTPGVIQSTLQRTIYACLTELSRPEFVYRTLGTGKTKRGRR